MIEYQTTWSGAILLIRRYKNYELCTKRKRKKSAKYEPSFVIVKCCDGSQKLFKRKISCHMQRFKITILAANWQHFRSERIAKCSYFILSTQNIKFH